MNTQAECVGVILSREGVSRASDRHPGRERCRLERLSGRTFWFLWATIILISAAFYYEKAADHRSAFVRWRPQVLQFWSGVNIYDKMLFPNPPIMPISLYPLMVMPTVAGAMCWFAIKVAMTTAVLLMCFEIVKPRGQTAFPPMMSLVDLAALAPADPGRFASRQQQPAHPVSGDVDVLRLAQRLGHRRRAAACAGNFLQGYAGAFLHLFRVQAIVAHAFLGCPGHGDFPDHRAEHGDRADFQWRMPGNVV